MFGSALVVDIDYEDCSDTFRYEGIDNAFKWVEQLNILQIYYSARQRIIAFVNSRERTKFSEILTLLQNVDSKSEDVIRLFASLFRRKTN